MGALSKAQVVALAAAAVLCLLMPGATGLLIKKPITVAVLNADLLGVNEVSMNASMSGDLTASGTAVLKILESGPAWTLIFQITAVNLKGGMPPFAAHIHRGPAGVAGPIAFAFPGKWRTVRGAPVLKYKLQGSVRGAYPVTVGNNTTTLKRVLTSVLKHPKYYYVNYHTVPFPAGADRGQLYY